MYWLQRFFTPRNGVFIIFVLVLASISTGEFFYEQLLQRRYVTRMVSSVRRAFVDESELPKMKMERSSLEFELPNLPSKFPILANAELARDWSTAATLCETDPDVGRSWSAYLGHVGPQVLKDDPGLESYLTLREAYDADVVRIAEDVSIRDKAAGLMELRTTRFAALFENSVYLDDRKAFEAAAGKLADESTVALRKAYWSALVEAATNTNPNLAGYGSAMLDLNTRTDELRMRLDRLTDQLAGIGELPEVSRQITSRSRPAPLVGKTRVVNRLLSLVPDKVDFVTVELVAVLMGFLITMPVELRHRRWMMISATAVLVYLGLLAMRVPMNRTLAGQPRNISVFLAYCVPSVLLAALWTPALCQIAAKGLLLLVDSSGSTEPNFSSLGPAYSAARRNDLREALRLAKPALVEDHRRYEALLLRAKLHRHLNHTWRTKRTLRRLLSNRKLTDGQREHATTLLGNLNDSGHDCWKL
jgi:hypothetical protein